MLRLAARVSPRQLEQLSRAAVQLGRQRAKAQGDSDLVPGFVPSPGLDENFGQEQVRLRVGRVEAQRLVAPVGERAKLVRGPGEACELLAGIRSIGIELEARFQSLKRFGHATGTRQPKAKSKVIFRGRAVRELCIVFENQFSDCQRRGGRARASTSADQPGRGAASSGLNSSDAELMQ